MLALPGCTVFGGAKPNVIVSKTRCADLVPDRWTASAEQGGGVQHAPDPEPAAPAPTKPQGVEAPTATWLDYWRSMYQWALAEQKKWTGFGVAEAQKVEDANGRTRDSVKLIGDCEDRDTKGAIQAAK